jgi:cytosine/adenosine deaminase-related metal-dependent hydrolase
VIRPDVLPTPLNSDSVVGHLINTIDGDDVRTVIVDGRILVKDRNVLTTDAKEAQRKAQEAAAGLWERLRNAKPQVETI